MMATSHAITGAAIALTVKEPVLALPLAFVSHFALDSLPHIGLDEFGGHHNKKELFRKILVVDAACLAFFILFLFMSGAPGLVFACLFLAGSPDFVWAYKYVFQEKFGNIKRSNNKNWFNRFHSSIQWSQTLQGSFLEIPYALSVLAFVIIKL